MVAVFLLIWTEDSLDSSGESDDYDSDDNTETVGNCTRIFVWSENG